MDRNVVGDISVGDLQWLNTRSFLLKNLLDFFVISLSQ